jgi:DNA mismatch repair protein MutS
MNLDVDKQTLADLALFPSGQQKQSVLPLLGKTQTLGGEDTLSVMFSTPLSDSEEIKERVAVFAYLQSNEVHFNIDKNICDFAEYYLKGHSPVGKFPLIIGLLNKIIYAFNNNNEHYIIQQGVFSTVKLLEELIRFADHITVEAPKLLLAYKQTITATCQSEGFAWIKELAGKAKLTAAEIIRADHLFRNVARHDLKSLLEITYQLDAYLTVSASSKAKGFTLPVIADSVETTLIFKGLFHPLLEHPISNDVEFNTERNICFITGTNMAGKSTLLKAMGVAVYLSQLGFPVPAAYMKTSLFNGLITTINLSDDIDQGHSHFYREVLRVKQVAQKVHQLGHVFVIFDELFRGTNVKDAYDASLAIISAFTNVKTCFFVVSTHIVEVAHQLAKNESISFRYMETAFADGQPLNSYQLKEGITEERLGMWMVNNERILEIIKGSE